MNSTLKWTFLFLMFGTSKAMSCPIFNFDDPFAITDAIVSGPYKDECVNTDKFRTSRRVNESEKQRFFSRSDIETMKQSGVDLLNDPSVEVIANFQAADSQGKDHFYVAVVPTTRVHDAVMELTQLNKMFGVDKVVKIQHGQIRLNLTKNGPPIFLIDQIRNQQNREIRQLNDDLILTISGVKPTSHEDSYDPVRGLRPGYYDEEFQIGSVQSLTLNWIRSEKYSTKEYRLNLTEDESRLALEKAIDLGTKNGLIIPYSTLTSSCLNIAFLILHEVKNTSDKTTWQKLAQSSIPLTSLRVLGLVNWLDSASYVQTLR